MFTNNRCNTGGGLFLISGTDTHNIISITNGTFTGNTIGLYGGGLLIVPGTNNNVKITNSTLSNNSKCGLFLFPLTDSKVTLSQVLVSNNNESGIVAIGHVTVVFSEGHSIIANNSSPTDGGGIYLGKNCYLTTSNGGHVSFINNTAHRYGGAIYSPDNDYTSLRHNVQVIMTYHDLCTVYNLSATFIDNSAIMAGDLLYGGVFMFCKGSKSMAQCYKKHSSMF